MLSKDYFSSIKTFNESVLVLERFEHLLNNESKKWEQLLSESEVQILQEYAKLKGINFGLKSNVKEVIKQAINDLKQVPTLTLTLAFDPSLNTLKRIVMLLENEIKYKFFLKTKLDKSVIGGAIFELNGKVFNYSLKNKFK